MIKIFIFFLLIGCSSRGLVTDSPELQKRNESILFEYSDNTGEYLAKREIKIVKNKLVSRVTILSRDGLQELETQVSMSKLGTLKNSKDNTLAILPEASQFKVWFNKELYSSNMRFNPTSKTITTIAKSPSTDKETLKDFKIPKGNYFCFFSQLPECLKMQNLLLKAASKSVPIYLIWDSYPYHVEQYENLLDSPLMLATLTLTEHDKNEYKFALDIGNQIIFYHFDKKLNFVKMFWISQGISLVNTNKG